MKTKFDDFINEVKKEKTFKDFISDIKKSLMTDFSYNETQAQVYIEQYKDLFVKFYAKDFGTKEAIAATKLPGVKVENSKTNESYQSMDNDIDNLTSIIENIKTKQDLGIAHNSMKKYFDDYSSKSYSDIRVFERIKNNYKKIKKLYKEKLNSFNKKY